MMVVNNFRETVAIMTVIATAPQLKVAQDCIKTRKSLLNSLLMDQQTSQMKSIKMLRGNNQYHSSKKSLRKLAKVQNTVGERSKSNQINKLTNYRRKYLL